MKHRCIMLFFTLTFFSLVFAMEKGTAHLCPKDAYADDAIVYERSNIFEAAVELYKGIGSREAWVTLKEEVWRKQLEEQPEKKNHTIKKSTPSKPIENVNFEETHDKEVISNLLGKLQKQFSLNSEAELRQFFHDELNRILESTTPEQLLTMHEVNGPPLKYRFINKQNSALKAPSAIFLNKEKGTQQLAMITEKWHLIFMLPSQKFFLQMREVKPLKT